MLSDRPNLHHLTAGFIAVLVGYTSSAAIIFQAAEVANRRLPLGAIVTCGIATVTYLFEGEILHRDSHGSSHGTGSHWADIRDTCLMADCMPRSGELS